MPDLEPEDRWEPCDVDITFTGGPSRIYDADPDEDEPRYAGFAPPPAREREPLLWEGDDA